MMGEQPRARSRHLDALVPMEDPSDLIALLSEVQTSGLVPAAPARMLHSADANIEAIHSMAKARLLSKLG